MNRGNCGVYEILNTTNLKRYIGSSKDLAGRRKSHFSDLRNGHHDNSHLQNAWNKYGSDNFEFNVIIYCGKHRRHIYEQYLLDRSHAKTNENYYNQSGEVLTPPIMSGEDNPNWKDKINLECKNCGDSYEVMPYRQEESKFCSLSCANQYNKMGKRHPRWKGGQIKLYCKYCDKQYETDSCQKDRSNFCSENCQYLWMSENKSGGNNPQWEGGKIELECNYCKNKYEVKSFEETYSRYCSYECRGKDKVGEESNGSKLTKSQVKNIKRRLENGETQTSIAKDFSVTYDTIGQISRGETWSHVTINE